MVGIGKPLEIRQVTTVTPQDNEIRVKVEWTGSGPFDVHQADGGIGVQHPQCMGDVAAGAVVEIGPSATKYKVGDKVFGFQWRSGTEKAHQTYSTAPENLWSRVPTGFTLQELVTVPTNFVTAWHTITKDLGLELPWPKPENHLPKEAHEWVLVWGGSSSVGQYVLQVLKFYGYSNLLAVASKGHHETLKNYGAVACFDYRSGDVTEAITTYVRDQGAAKVSYIVDTIGSEKSSLQPVAKIARNGSVVAVMLPVIIKDFGKGVTPEYSFEVRECADWASGVEALGVPTHSYMNNKFLADHLQSDIMPAILELGVIEPNKQIVVEGADTLERAEKALSLLRRKEVSGARIVWRVAAE